MPRDGGEFAPYIIAAPPVFLPDSGLQEIAGIVGAIRNHLKSGRHTVGWNNSWKTLEFWTGLFSSIDRDIKTRLQSPITAVEQVRFLENLTWRLSENHADKIANSEKQKNPFSDFFAEKMFELRGAIARRRQQLASPPQPIFIPSSINVEEQRILYRLLETTDDFLGLLNSNDIRDWPGIKGYAYLRNEIATRLSVIQKQPQDHRVEDGLAFLGWTNGRLEALSGFYESDQNTPDLDFLKSTNDQLRWILANGHAGLTRAVERAIEHEEAQRREEARIIHVAQNFAHAYNNESAVQYMNALRPQELNDLGEITWRINDVQGLRKKAEEGSRLDVVSLAPFAQALTNLHEKIFARYEEVKDPQSNYRLDEEIVFLQEIQTRLTSLHQDLVKKNQELSIGKPGVDAAGEALAATVSHRGILGKFVADHIEQLRSQSATLHEQCRQANDALLVRAGEIAEKLDENSAQEWNAFLKHSGTILPPIRSRLETLFKKWKIDFVALGQKSELTLLERCMVECNNLCFSSSSPYHWAFESVHIGDARAPLDGIYMWLQERDLELAQATESANPLDNKLLGALKETMSDLLDIVDGARQRLAGLIIEPDINEHLASGAGFEGQAEVEKNLAAEAYINEYLVSGEGFEGQAEVEKNLAAEAYINEYLGSGKPFEEQAEIEREANRTHLRNIPSLIGRGAINLGRNYANNIRQNWGVMGLSAVIGGGVKLGFAATAVAVTVPVAATAAGAMAVGMIGYGILNLHSNLRAARRDGRKLGWKKAALEVGVPTALGTVILAGAVFAPSLAVIATGTSLAAIVGKTAATLIVSKYRGQQLEKGWLRNTVRESFVAGLTGGVIGAVAADFFHNLFSSASTQNLSHHANVLSDLGSKAAASMDMHAGVAVPAGPSVPAAGIADQPSWVGAATKTASFVPQHVGVQGVPNVHVGPDVTAVVQQHIDAGDFNNLSLSQKTDLSNALKKGDWYRVAARVADAGDKHLHFHGAGHNAAFGVEEYQLADWIVEQKGVKGPNADIIRRSFAWLQKTGRIPTSAPAPV
jgi:hypothetical protein